MTWVRLDDDFYHHPKVLNAGPLGIAMQTVGLCYCNHYLTDGFIPVSVIPGLLNLDGIGMRMWDSKDGTFGGGEDASWNMIVDDLVTAGLWEPCDGGYMIHDYLQYQPSKAQVLAERESNARRQEEWRKTHRDASGKYNAVSNAVSNGECNTAPIPIPIPIPIPNQQEELSGANAPEQKPKSKPRKTNSDPRTSKPAIQACRTVASRFPPIALYDSIIEALGNADAVDIEKLRACYVEWLGRGYNANSWKWATEWYVTGVPSRNGNAGKSTGDGKSRGVQAVEEFERRMGISA